MKQKEEVCETMDVDLINEMLKKESVEIYECLQSLSYKAKISNDKQAIKELSLIYHKALIVFTKQ